MMCAAALQVTDHARQLLEKHLGLSFLNAGYSGPTPRMNLQQVQCLHSTWAHSPVCCSCTPSASHALLVRPETIPAGVCGATQQFR